MYVKRSTYLDVKVNHVLFYTCCIIINLFSDNSNIIKTPYPEYEPNGGIGYEFFRIMKFYKNNVAQVNYYTYLYSLATFKYDKIFKLSKDLVICWLKSAGFGKLL
jgi:hypothetical protein